LELFQEEEEARLSAERNAKWLEDEAKAQKLWSELQEKLAVVRAERAKQEVCILSLKTALTTERQLK